MVYWHVMLFSQYTFNRFKQKPSRRHFCWTCRRIGCIWVAGLYCRPYRYIIVSKINFIFFEIFLFFFFAQHWRKHNFVVREESSTQFSNFPKNIPICLRKWGSIRSSIIQTVCATKKWSAINSIIFFFFSLSHRRGLHFYTAPTRWRQVGVWAPRGKMAACTQSRNYFIECHFYAVRSERPITC